MTELTEQPLTARQQIEANIVHVRNQQANLMLQKQQAEEAVAKCTEGIAQSAGAIAAYEETLKLLPPAPAEPPDPPDPPEPPAGGTNAVPT